MSSFSVVITTHKRPLMLSRALGSLKGQSHRDIQIVVVADAPCAETYGVVTAMLGGSDRFVQRTDRPGPAASRNLGLQLADAEFTVFLDDDDAFTESFFADVERLISADDILYTDYHVVFEQNDGNDYVPLAAERKSLAARHIDDLHVKNFIPLHCLVYPTPVLRRCRFDPTLELNEDWAFLLAVGRQAPFRHAPIAGPIVYTRAQADNRGRSNNDHLLADIYRRVYKSQPSPTPEIASARRRFMAAQGLESSLADL